MRWDLPPEPRETPTLDKHRHDTHHPFPWGTLGPSTHSARGLLSPLRTQAAPGVGSQMQDATHARSKSTRSHHMVWGSIQRPREVLKRAASTLQVSPPGSLLQRVQLLHGGSIFRSGFIKD